MLINLKKNSIFIYNKDINHYEKVVIPSLYLFLFLITFIVNACTKLASDFDANSSVEEIIKNANEAFDKRDYTRAAEIYLKVEELYPYSDSSREALIKQLIHIT